jgi:hypothetical protein
MGILDDAIREHLELKRQHGADNDDLDRLEKEAFGPPTRPGDPEFDTSEGQAAAPAAAAIPEGDVGLPSTAPPEPADAGAGENGASEAAASAPEAPETSEPSAPEGGGLFDAEASDNDEDWLASLEDVVEQPAIESTGEAEPEAPEREAEAPESTTSPIEDLTPAERARIEHADLGDTIDHPAVDPSETGDETGEQGAAAPPPPETGEEDVAAPPEPPESAIFDQGDADFGDLDLDLDDAELEPEPPRPAAGPTTSTEMDAVPPVPAEPGTGEEEYVADDEEEDELEDEDEDLLEETPDFLQDTPEGERLWFEQGAPKDFDFDDEDDEDDD